MHSVLGFYNRRIALFVIVLFMINTIVYLNFIQFFSILAGLITFYLWLLGVKLSVDGKRKVFAKLI